MLLIRRIATWVHSTKVDFETHLPMLLENRNSFTNTLNTRLFANTYLFMRPLVPSPNKRQNKKLLPTRLR